MKRFLKASKIELFSEKIHAIVEQQISLYKPGRVHCLGKYWPARLYLQDCKIILEPLDPVVVVGIEGMTLLILPSASSPGQQHRQAKKNYPNPCFQLAGLEKTVL